MTELLESAVLFKQAGYSDEDAAQLSQISALYQNIADKQLTAGESASFLVSQMKAYNLTADEAINAIDQINEVDILAFPIGNIWVIKDNYIG